MLDYKKLKNSYSKIIKSSWKEELEIEIGDVKQPDNFLPQVKVKKWGNEVNASFRLVDNESKQLSSGNGRIELTGDKKKTCFYELPKDDNHPAGGYEFEVIFNDKPVSNVVEFTIKTKNIDFQYQPPLTETELPPNGVHATETDIFDKDGNVVAHRPENVVGSYVAYHRERPNNYTNGKLYRTGIAFNIFRPKIVDSNGDWTWGELKIDEKQKILSITIPQEFLNKAIYPIIVDPTFGYSVEGLSTSGWPMTYIAGVRGTPTTSGIAEKITFWSKGTGDTVKGGYYLGNDLIALSASAVPTIADGEVDIALDGEEVIADTEYVVCIRAASGPPNLDFAFNTVAPSNSYYDNSDWANPIAWDKTNYSYDWTIYCTYSEPSPTKTQTISTKASIAKEIVIQVGANNDDGYQIIGGAQTLDSSVYVGVNSDQVTIYNGGVRFQNVPIPNGSVILSAILEGYKTGAGGDEASSICRSKVRGEMADNPSDFASTNINARTRGDTGIDWDNRVDIASGWHNTDEIKTVIQEILDRTSFASGNAMVLFLDNDKTDISGSEYAYIRWRDYDSTPNDAFKITILYQPLSGQIVQKVSAKANIEAAPIRNFTAKAHIRKDWNPDVAYTITNSYIYNLNNQYYKIGKIFRYNGPSNPINKISLFTYDGGVGTSPTYRIGFQSISNGAPSGTWLGATNSGYVDSQLNNAINWQEFTLGEDVTLTPGEEYAIVIEYQSGTIDSSNYRRILYSSLSGGAFITEKPHFEPYDPQDKDYWQPNWNVQQSFTSSPSWQEFAANRLPIFYLVTDASEYYGPGVPRVANLGIYSTTQYGLKFVADQDSVVNSVGGFVMKWGSPADDLYYEILDVTDGDAVLASGTLATAAEVSGTPGWLYKDLSSEINFVQGNTYALVFTSPSSVDGGNGFGVPVWSNLISERTTKYKMGDLYYSTNGGGSYSTYTNYLPPVRVEATEIISISTQTVKASAYIQPPRYIQRRVGYSPDDAFDYENIAYDSSYYTANNTRQGHRDPDETYGDNTAGYRFRNIVIPNGKAIMSAYFKGVAYFTEAYTVDVRIQGVDLDNATDFSSDAPRDKTPLTTELVDWTIPVCTEDDIQTSPDLKNIIQEIIDRGGWSTGNAVDLIIKNNGATGSDNRSFRTWDYGNINNAIEKAPSLIIEYGDTTTQTVAAKARITTSKIQTITAIGRITIASIQTISAKANIKQSFAQIITAKGHIKKTVESSLSALGRIQQSFEQTANAKARIKDQQTQTVSAKGRIQISSQQSIEAKGRIKIISSQTISAGADIKKQIAQTVAAKGAISRQFTQTVSAKAKLILPWYWPTTLNITEGAIDSGTLRDVYLDDGNELILNEISGPPPGFDYDFLFENIPEVRQHGLHVMGFYDGNPNHNVKLYQWNYALSQWDPLTDNINDIPKTFTEEMYEFIGLLPTEDYMNNGELKIRVFHSAPANPSHRLHFDLFVLHDHLMVRNVFAKGNIFGTANQTISTLGRITATSTQTVSAKGRIQKTSTQTINALGRIQKEATQSIAAKGRIQFSNTQTVIAKGRIQFSSEQTISALGRITISTSQTISALGRIKKLSNQNIDALGRIQKQSAQTINALGRIEKQRTKTFAAKGRIQISSEQTIEAKGLITSQGVRTIEAKGQIAVIGGQIINAKASIKKSQEQIITAKAAIAKNFIQTVNSLGRIEIKNSQTITALGRIVSTQIQTIETRGRITKINQQSIQALGRIQKQSTQTLTALGRITISISREISAKAAIQKSFIKIIVAKARIAISSTQTIDAKADIKKQIVHTINSKGRISLLGLGATIDAKANIKKTQETTVGAKAAISKTLIQTTQALGRIQKSESKTINSKANIVATLIQTIESKARINKIKSANISALGRITTAGEKTINAKGRIQTIGEQTIDSKGRIQIGNTQTINALGRISSEESQTINSIGNIRNEIQQIVSAKASIKSPIIKIIEAKGRIEIERTKIIESKANLLIIVLKTINSKGSIFGTTEQTIDAKASIILTVEKTIQSKANILQSISRTISAKGAIATYEVVEIIDKIRSQDIIEEITYVKSKTTAVSYNKVDAVNIVDERVKVEGVQSSRVQVINITDLSRVIETKWVTAKARIRR